MTDPSRTAHERLAKARSILAGYGISTARLTDEHFAEAADALEQAAAVLRARRGGAPQGWQPIETAPKNGTEILVRCQNRAGLPGTVVAHFADWVEDHPPIDAAFYFWNGGMFTPATKPTHWMPLPSPPGEASPAHGAARNCPQCGSSKQERIAGLWLCQNPKCGHEWDDPAHGAAPPQE